MKRIILTPAAVGVVCLLASTAFAQHGSARRANDARNTHQRGSEATHYRNTGRSSATHNTYQLASHHRSYGYPSYRSQYGYRGQYRPQYGRPSCSRPYYPPVAYPVVIPRSVPSVIVERPYYAPEPYYYPRRGVSYESPGFSIGIGF